MDHNQHVKTEIKGNCKLFTVRVAANLMLLYCLFLPKTSWNTSRLKGAHSAFCFVKKNTILLIYSTFFSIWFNVGFEHLLVKENNVSFCSLENSASFLAIVLSAFYHTHACKKSCFLTNLCSSQSFRFRLCDMAGPPDQAADYTLRDTGGLAAGSNQVQRHNLHQWGGNRSCLQGTGEPPWEEPGDDVLGIQVWAVHVCRWDSYSCCFSLVINKLQLYVG